jgi:hypothetical protein
MLVLTTLLKNPNFTLFICRIFCFVLPKPSVQLSKGHFKEMDLFFHLTHLRTTGYFLHPDLGVF